MDLIIWAKSIQRGDKTVPLTVNNSAQRWNVFDVSGKLILSDVRYPFFAAARHFIGAGCSPDATLWLVPPGQRNIEHYYLRGRLGYAARLTVSEATDGAPRLAPWVPRPIPA